MWRGKNGFKKGNDLWKRRKNSTAYRQKLSDALRGRTISLEWRQHMSEGQKRRFQSSNERQRLSEKSKGRKQSLETVLKRSLKLQGNKFNLGRRGWKHKPETIAKIKAKRKLQVLPPKDTVPELTLQLALSKRGILFRKHEPIIGQPDIFIEPNICIFVDGCFWHGCEQCLSQARVLSRLKAKEHDAKVSQVLREKGYTVLRFWEHEIRNHLEICLQLVQELIGTETLRTVDVV